jgi:hypothetical protein
MEIDGTTENEAKIKRTASSLNISGQKTVSARTCDTTCNGHWIFTCHYQN